MKQPRKWRGYMFAGASRPPALLKFNGQLLSRALGRRLVVDLAFYSAAAGLALWVVICNADIGAAIFFIASRSAYVLFTGVALQKQSQQLGRQDREVAELCYTHFRQIVVRLLNLDALAFVTLSVETRNSLTYSYFLVDGAQVALMALGAVLIVFGVGIKGWAVKAIGIQSYTWYDFFLPEEHFNPCRSGPYRFLNNPMYTLGYLHCYGIALLCQSWPGLLGSFFAHAAILVMNQIVEKPHLRRLCGSHKYQDLVSSIVDQELLPRHRLSASALPSLNYSHNKTGNEND